MSRLRVLMAILFVILIMLTGSAIAYARTLPQPPLADFEGAGLKQCGGKFCLFGIVPGTTGWREAKSTIAPYVTRDEGDHVHAQSGSIAIRVAVDATGEQTSGIQIQASSGTSPYPLALQFSDVISRFGIPCGASSIGSMYGGVELIYPGFHVVIQPVDGHLVPYSPVGGFTLVQDENLSTENKVCSADQKSSPWRGLASIQVYHVQRGYNPGNYSYGNYGP